MERVSAHSLNESVAVWFLFSFLPTHLSLSLTLCLCPYSSPSTPFVLSPSPFNRFLLCLHLTLHSNSFGQFCTLSSSPLSLSATILEEELNTFPSVTQKNQLWFKSRKRAGKKPALKLDPKWISALRVKWLINANSGCDLFQGSERVAEMRPTEEKKRKGVAVLISRKLLRLT